MLVAADSKIPMADEAFAEFGEVRVLATPLITRESVADAEILLVRSETRVDRSLLEASRVRFVGTATIGTDHVDVDWLRRAGIGFAAAPGCNADSVKEYVIAALLKLAAEDGRRLDGATLGVVGVGNIGSRVAAAAPALGLKVLCNDPPKARATGEARFLTLDDLMAADFLTIHVPLHAGPDNTRHLFDADRMSKMKPGAVLINTSRGPVVDNAALKRMIQAGKLAPPVLDVWEGEPSIDLELAPMVRLGTSHIAGYSLDGKVRGTRMVYEEACRHFHRTPGWDGFLRLPPPRVGEVRLDGAEDGGEVALLHAIVRSCYDIGADHARLRQILSIPAEGRAAFFRGLRKDYPVRREFSATRVAASPQRETLARKLAAMGFSRV